MRFRTFLSDYTKKSFKMMIIKKICITFLINNSNILILINVLPIPLMKFDKFYFSDHLKNDTMNDIFQIFLYFCAIYMPIGAI